MWKLGVFGGTFNPIHLAHVRMAKAFAGHLALEKVVLIPTYIPPHKQAAGLASAGDRLAMCRLAVEGLPMFEVSDYEIRRRGKSYTFRTLEHLHTQYPEAQLFLLMGADMFLTVQDWREPQELYRLATLCAVPRDEEETVRLREHKRFLEAQRARCVLLELPPMHLSSTDVRERIKADGAVGQLLHPEVQVYIREHGLYQ